MTLKIQKRGGKMGKEVVGEQTFVKGLNWVCAACDSNTIEVGVKNGKIIRIRPLHYDGKYRPEE
jgi:hypothetical protein